MMDKKKVCLVIPSLQAGGMERVMSELAGYFCKKNDLHVHLLLYGKEPEIFYYVPEGLIIHKPITVFNDRFRQIYSLGRLIYLRHTVRKINPDSILSFGEYWNSFVLLALYGLHYRVFISDRCSPEKEFSTFHSFLRKWLYPKAKGIIAQSEKAKQLYYSHICNNNVSVIGNPIRQIDSQGSQISKENIVLTVGRLINSKHHDELIKIFAQISKPNWKLIIVGDDALKQKNMERLKKLIHNLGSDDRIILTGALSNIDNLFLRSKIFAFMSTSEGFPNVIGEAMSAGLPIIVRDCFAGPAEMICNEEDGFLIPINDNELFQKKLEALMNDESLRDRLGSKARISILKFSIDNIGSAYYNLICKNLE
jgi:glycosyltransferase involved in cell wall biosynthesis